MEAVADDGRVDLAKLARPSIQEKLAQLSFRRRALNPVFSSKDAAAQTDLFNAGDKRIPAVDEDCWRAVEADLISSLRRVNELVLDRHVITGEISKYLPDPLVRKLPMRAPVEVLNRDLHACGATRSVSTRPTSNAWSTGSKVVPSWAAIHLSPVLWDAKKRTRSQKLSITPSPQHPPPAPTNTNPP